jgi:sugar lactone lactonase YvrE
MTRSAPVTAIHPLWPVVTHEELRAMSRTHGIAAACLAVSVSVAGAAAVPVSAGPRAANGPVGQESAISTLAGTGEAGDAGDGGPADQAELRQPRDTAVAPDGSIAIVDTRNHRVRRVGLRGKITTIVGTGVAGSSGDGGPAVAAQLNLPHDVAFDADGNLFIADAKNHLVRRVDRRTKRITTVAGTGEPGYNGDGIAAVEAQLRNPKSVAVRGNRLYIADSINERIRRVNLRTGVIRTVVGSGEKGYGGDGGQARDALLNVPQRIAFSRTGDLYIADAKNNRIRRVDAETAIITTAVGDGQPAYDGDGGPGDEASIATPRGVTVAGRWLYVADSGNHVVRRMNLDSGVIRTVAGTGVPGYAGDGGPAGEAELRGPRGLSVEPGGRLVIADTLTNTVRLVAP